jgi:hypothetical protein
MARVEAEQAEHRHDLPLELAQRRAVALPTAGPELFALGHGVTQHHQDLVGGSQPIGARS